MDIFLVPVSYTHLDVYKRQAYTFTDGWVRKLGVKNLKIYLNGNNLWVWSKMPDDRESNFAGSGNQGAYPCLLYTSMGIGMMLRKLREVLWIMR